MIIVQRAHAAAPGGPRTTRVASTCLWLSITHGSFRNVPEHAAVLPAGGTPFTTARALTIAHVRTHLANCVSIAGAAGFLSELLCRAGRRTTFRAFVGGSRAGGRRRDPCTGPMFSCSERLGNVLRVLGGFRTTRAAVHEGEQALLHALLHGLFGRHVAQLRQGLQPVTAAAEAVVGSVHIGVQHELCGKGGPVAVAQRVVVRLVSFIQLQYLTNCMFLALRHTRKISLIRESDVAVNVRTVYHLQTNNCTQAVYRTQNTQQ